MEENESKWRKKKKRKSQTHTQTDSQNEYIFITLFHIFHYYIIFLFICSNKFLCWTLTIPMVNKSITIYNRKITMKYNDTINDIKLLDNFSFCFSAAFNLQRMQFRWSIRIEHLNSVFDFVLLCITCGICSQTCTNLVLLSINLFSLSQSVSLLLR